MPILILTFNGLIGIWNGKDFVIIVNLKIKKNGNNFIKNKMTHAEFDSFPFKAGMTVFYNGKDYPIQTINFQQHSFQIQIGKRMYWIPCISCAIPPAPDSLCQKINDEITRLESELAEAKTLGETLEIEHDLKLLNNLLK